MRGWFYNHKEHGLCLTFKAMTDCGVSYRTLESASNRGARSWAIIPHPEHGKLKLIRWNKLSDCHKEKVTRRIGDPVAYMTLEPIRELIETDYKAEEYFRNRLIEMKVTDVNGFVSKYTSAASLLNMLVKVTSEKRYIKNKLGLKWVDDFWKHVGLLIDKEEMSLPSNYSRLLIKIKEYKEQGYDCLISGKFGNKNTAKIGKSEDGFDAELAGKQIALIRKAASMHNNFDAMQVTGFVNQIFMKNGWPAVSHGTVYRVIKANEHLTTAGSRGKRVYRNEIAMQVKRSRPEFPLKFFTLDGWTVELAYLNEKGVPTRLVAAIVLDAMNNYPIGYAIGDSENAELIRLANRNAILHTQELFGAPYRPWQIQSDNFAIKQNTPFFQAMAHLHTPAAVGNAKSKPIEPYFMYLNKKYCQTQYNWMGFNVDAKKSNQVNREFSNQIKKSFPTKTGVIAQIEAIIMAERTLKIDQYMQQWEALPESEKVTLQRLDWLMVFGKPTGYTNSITGMGLMPTIQGQKLIYDSFHPQFRALQHLSWKVIYDEYDLSSILVISEDDKHRFVLEQKRVIPMAIRDMQPEDHAYLNKINDYNKGREKEVMQTYIHDAAIVEDVIENTLYLDSEAELALKGMFTYNGHQKESLQDAKGLKRIKKKELKQIANEHQQEQENWHAMQQQYLQTKVDFNQNWD